MKQRSGTARSCRGSLLYPFPEFWGVFDTLRIFGPITAGFQEGAPQVTGAARKSRPPCSSTCLAKASISAPSSTPVADILRSTAVRNIGLEQECVQGDKHTISGG